MIALIKPEQAKKLSKELCASDEIKKDLKAAADKAFADGQPFVFEFTGYTSVKYLRHYAREEIKGFIDRMAVDKIKECRKRLIPKGKENAVYHSKFWNNTKYMKLRCKKDESGQEHVYCFVDFREFDEDFEKQVRQDIATYLGGSDE